MGENDAGLDDIKYFLEETFQAYERAHTRSEFHETVFQVHAALDHALTLHLGQDQREVPLPKKLWTFLPAVAREHRVGRLNGQRNALAHHPWRVHDPSIVYHTSVDLVCLAQAAWFGLFGEAAPPVHHALFDPTPQAPAPSHTPADAVEAPEWGVQPAKAAPSVYQVAQPVRGNTTPVVPRPRAAPAPAYLRRWLPVFGALFVVAFIIGAIFLTWSNAPTQPAEVGVGGRVQVTVSPDNVLLVMAAPGIGQAQAAHYERGAVLDVTDGPILYQNLTWWKVRGPAGEGWTATDFLAPIGR